MSKLPIALQLYSLRDDAARDFPSVVRAAAEIGYAGVEFAGYFGMDSKDLRALLDELNLKAVSTHIGFDQLSNRLEDVLDYAETLGMSHIVCPGAPRNYTQNADGWKQFAAAMSDIGKKCKERGFTLSYHNHSHEFHEFGNSYALDIFFENADPQYVSAQLDLGWVLHAGVDPIAYLKRYAGRCPLVHVKDFDENNEQTEVGTGTLDLQGIVETAQAVGVDWLIIETERYNMSPVESVKVGYSNLKQVVDNA